MDERAQQLGKLYDTLDGNKQNYKTLFEEVARFILPTKVQTRQTMSPGTRRGAERYDSTAVDAADKLAANLSSTVIPRHQKWVTIRLTDKALNEIQPIVAWLDDCRDIMLENFASSNFYQVMDEAFLDLVGFCTDCVFVREAERTGPQFPGLVLEAWGVDEYVFTEGPDGRPDGVIRRFVLTAEQAERRFADLPRFRGWGEKMERALSSQAKPADRQKRFTFLHAVLPKKGKVAGVADDFVYSSEYTCVDDKKVLSVGGFYEFPCAITRWRKNTQDMGWGRGPGLNAMSDILTMNEASRLNMKAWAKDIDPPLVVRHKGVIGQLRTSPAGVTYVRKDNDIRYLESGGRYDVSRYNKEEVKQTIRHHFYTDQLERLVGDPQPNMTAYEFSKRVEMMQRLLGPTLGRLEHEKLNRIIFRAFQLHLRGGAFPPPPSELDGVSSTLAIEYVGPLALAQRGQEVDAIERVYAYGGRIAELKGDPSVLDNLDDDEALRMAHEMLGAPTDVLRDKKAVAALREARDKANQQAMAMQQAAEGAAIAKDAAAAGMVPPGSA